MSDQSAWTDRPVPRFAPVECSHEGEWWRDPRTFVWCADCGRWKEDILEIEAASEAALTRADVS